MSSVNNVAANNGWTDTIISTGARGVAAVGVPAYLLMRMQPGARLGHPVLTAGIIAITAPATLFCALGALEGMGRSLGAFVTYQTKRNSPEANHCWDQFTKESTTTFGLTKGALSPTSGYAVMANEIAKKDFDKAPQQRRILMNEYVSYRGLRATGRFLTELAVKGTEITIKVGSALWAATKTMAAATRDGAIASWNFAKPAVYAAGRFLKACVIGIGNGIKAIWNVVEPVVSAVARFVGRCIAETVKFVWKVVWDGLVLNVAVPVVKLAWKIVWDGLVMNVIWPITEHVIWPIIYYSAYTVATIIGIAAGFVAEAAQAAFKAIR